MSKLASPFTICCPGQNLLQVFFTPCPLSLQKRIVYCHQHYVHSTCILCQSAHPAIAVWLLQFSWISDTVRLILLPPPRRLYFTWCLSVLLFVCLLETSRKNYGMDLHENFTREVSVNKEELI